MNPPEDPSGQAKNPANKIEVAVLDDDYDFRNYMEDFLAEEGGYEVRAFACQEDLFKSCAKRPPEIVLLDMKMGEVSGEGVLEELLKLWPKLCVIVITGYPSLEDMRATFKLKVFDYLTKPFSLAQLRQTLRNAVETFGLGRSDQDRLRESLGHRIRLLRTGHEWSLKDLSGRTGLSVSQLSSIERGAHLPSMESLLVLSRALGQRASEVLASIGF